MTRANPALIGSFILGAIVLIIGSIFTFGSSKLLTHSVSCVMYFQGGVQGLRTGASVNFRGVKVGTVTDIRMQLDPQTSEIRVAVIADFPEGSDGRMGKRDMDMRVSHEAIVALVERGLRAQLQLESLVTGQLFIQLDFYGYDPLAGAGLPKARMDAVTGLLEIPTVPTTLQEISQAARKAIDTLADLPLAQMVIDLSDTLHSIRELVKAPEIQDLLRNANLTLVRTQHLVQQLEHEVGRLASGATTTLGTLEQLETDARQLIRQVGKEVGRIAASTTAAFGAAGTLVQQVDTPLAALLQSLREASNAAQAALGQGRETLTGLQQVLTPHAPVGHELVQTLRELGEAARSLRVLADYLERYPNAVVFGRKDGKGN